MSRNIMKAEIEREQDRGDAAWEACMQREADLQAAIEAEDEQYMDDWKRYDTQDHLAGADYYEGLLAGETDELPF